MEKALVCVNSRNTIKTDLSLLLESLKFQMKCPSLQKQALLTIHLICEKREDNVDLLREMGGVAFIYNLFKSSIVHADVREAALFTLGTLAEASVYCKNSLCRKEIFVDLTGYLTKEDTPLTMKRVSVYMLNVLVTNNKAGQTLAQATGCMDILLVLFRTTFPFPTETTLRTANATQNFQLWASMSSTLCGCVGNPQNEEGQQICVAAFPILNTWLQQVSLRSIEIFRPICTFIAMTVANNPRVQESFSASGGLVTLTFALSCLTSGSEMGLTSCQLSIIICNTLTACITNNPILASGLAQYGIVTYLLSLLAHPNLDSHDKLAVLLTLGHCTEASEEHQSLLVQCSGLPFIITLVINDLSEEVRKAATFILQTCKQTVMHLEVPGMMQAEAEEVKPLADTEVLDSSAKELLRRIEFLEKRQAQAAEIVWPDQGSPISAEEFCPPSVPSASSFPLPQTHNFNTIPPAYTQSGMLKRVETQRDKSLKLHAIKNIDRDQNDSERKPETADSSRRRENAKTSRGNMLCSMTRGSEDLSCQIPSLEGDRDTNIAHSQLPQPPNCDAPKMSIRSSEELQGRRRKLENIPMEERSLCQVRCAGCALFFDEVTSRTFESLLSSSSQLCDLHQHLKEATERFRSRQCRLPLERERQGNIAHPKGERVSAAVPWRSWDQLRELSLTPIHKESGRAKHTGPQYEARRHRGINLTPMRGGADALHSYNKTDKGGQHKCGREGLNHRSSASRDDCSTRRKRKNFSREEVQYLLSGVKTYGRSWNCILWSYPFKRGRTNVDLAKKYKRLMLEPKMTQDVDQPVHVPP